MFSLYIEMFSEFFGFYSSKLSRALLLASYWLNDFKYTFSQGINIHMQYLR